jgi:hypothetical protein
VLDDGKTVGAVVRDMDLTETAVREWVKRARADRTHGRTGLTTAEREELARLRTEERDILKKPRPSSRSTSSKVCLDRGGEGRLHNRGLLSRVACFDEWFPCLAATARIRAGASGSASARPDPRVPRGRSSTLWATAHLERPARGGRARQREAGRATNARGRVAGGAPQNGSVRRR